MKRFIKHGHNLVAIDSKAAKYLNRVQSTNREYWENIKDTNHLTDSILDRDKLKSKTQCK